MKSTQIPVRNRKKQIMLCVRFDHFKGECSLYQVTEEPGSADMLLMRASGAEGQMHCRALRSAWGLPGHRLAYTVHIPADEEVNPKAGVIIIVFTKRKILKNGCIELVIPDRPLGTVSAPLSGYIDFVAARGEGEKERR